jgi:hypothetical protein
MFFKIEYTTLIKHNKIKLQELRLNLTSIVEFIKINKN